MTISKAARTAALLISGSVLAASPALAQRVEQRGANVRPGDPNMIQREEPQQQQVTRNLSRAENAAIAPLLTAANAVETARAAGQTPNWAPVQQLLPAAQAAARSNDARYLVGRIQIAVLASGNDLPAQEAALNALLTNPATPAAEQTTLRNALNNVRNQRAEAAFAANDFATAERLYREMLQANPNDTRLQNNLRIVMTRMGNTTGALQGIEQQITTAEASGGRAPENLYRQVFDTQRRAQQRPAATAAISRLVTNYPTQANWRLAVDYAREMPADDRELLVDIYRLARATNSLQPAEYVPLANTLAQAANFAEADAILAAGLQASPNNAGITAARTRIAPRLTQDRAGIDAEIREARGSGTSEQAKNVADALFGYGRYAEAAELYRVAQTKGGQDANLLNTRIGVSLAMAGQRPQAEAALRAVTGQRAEIAALWLAWLARRPA